ncbi:MAG: S1C family serine protease [Candidatus Hermodarchaeia archaeon]|jgi:S1-C subfamily serine protease
MKRHPLTVLMWLVTFVLLVGLACGGPPGSDEPTDEPQMEPATPVVDEPDEQPELPPLEVSSLQDVQGSVIQIEAQGTFLDPEWAQYVGAGRGSGFIIDPSGIAVTNNHVVTGAALLKVWIGGDTSKTYNARVLGVSECSDLAVIDIDGEGFPYLTWFDDPIHVGLEVYTAGFPLGDPEYTLTKGIISKESANGETNWASIDSVLMHDATINPGNSGGPLIDAGGKVVGVNYAAYKEADQYFAIGKDVAVPLVKTLQGGQNVDSVGINGTAVVSDDGSLSGIWVSSVASGSAADKAGITGGDILTTLESFPLATDGTMSDYCDIVRTHSAGETISIEVLRFLTEEYLTGQLNGPPLSVADTGDILVDDGTEGDSPAFYIEEFDPDSPTVGDWSWYLTNGEENGFDIYTENGKLVFDIDGYDIYSYFSYDPWFYEDVRVDALAENRGKNNNNVSLICRATDYGWYEFSIANNGLWWIWAYDGAYTLLSNGGSTAVNMGKDVNEYTIMCFGDTLALYINGAEVHTMTETKFGFREGQIGIGVSSFDVLPIIVEFDWVVISDSME